MKKNLDIANKFCSPLALRYIEVPLHIFFQLPKLNKYCLRIELAPAHQVIKKLKMDHISAGICTFHFTARSFIRTMIQRAEATYSWYASSF